mmetsp:Transcript_73122/g.171519  ORF Transcript_73122/g.171519 Transcript_73122/m.171519 type:complete len:214 (-) Transcript_73122:52-693(-)
MFHSHTIEAGQQLFCLRGAALPHQWFSQGCYTVKQKSRLDHLQTALQSPLLRKQCCEAKHRTEKCWPPPGQQLQPYVAEDRRLQQLYEVLQLLLNLLCSLHGSKPRGQLCSELVPVHPEAKRQRADWATQPRLHQNHRKACRSDLAARLCTELSTKLLSLWTSQQTTIQNLHEVSCKGRVLYGFKRLSSCGEESLGIYTFAHQPDDQLTSTRE